MRSRCGQARGVAKPGARAGEGARRPLGCPPGGRRGRPRPAGSRVRNAPRCPAGVVPGRWAGVAPAPFPLKLCGGRVRLFSRDCVSARILLQGPGIGGGFCTQPAPALVNAASGLDPPGGRLGGWRSSLREFVSPLFRGPAGVGWWEPQTGPVLQFAPRWSGPGVGWGSCQGSLRSGPPTPVLQMLENVLGRIFPRRELSGHPAQVSGLGAGAAAAGGVRQGLNLASLLGVCPKSGAQTLPSRWRSNSVRADSGFDWLLIFTLMICRIEGVPDCGVRWEKAEICGLSPLFSI